MLPTANLLRFRVVTCYIVTCFLYGNMFFYTVTRFCVVTCYVVTCFRVVTCFFTSNMFAIFARFRRINC